MRKKGGSETRFDQRFKDLMTNREVLSRVIGAFIPKLGGIGVEGINRIWENGSIVQLNSEMISIESASCSPMFSIKSRSLARVGSSWTSKGSSITVPT